MAFPGVPSFEESKLPAIKGLKEIYNKFSAQVVNAEQFDTFNEGLNIGRLLGPWSSTVAHIANLLFHAPLGAMERADIDNTVTSALKNAGVPPQEAAEQAQKSIETV